MKENKNKEMIQAGDAWQAMRVMGELVNGYDTLNDISKSVTFFGSARINDENHPYYKGARKLAEICADFGFNIITGGGPGLMKAANQGAKDSDNKVISCGIGIELPFESGNNKYVDKNYNLQFRYFFIRKLMMMNFSELYVGLPGGFGTIEEVFEIITLMQTEKLPKKPVILYGKKYWSNLIKSIEVMIEEGMASQEDLNLIHVIDNEEDIKEFLWKSEK